MTHAIVNTKHKSIVVPTSEAIANLFPDAPRIDLGGQAMMVVPYRPTEAFILRQFGYEVDAPIMHLYDWAGGKPFDIQRKTCAMLSMNKRAYVLNGMGTGKTKAALWAWDYLYSNGAAKKLLVLAPLSTLKFTWGREVFNTLPHRKFSVLHGTKQKRIDALADPEADVYIINHDGFKVVQKEIEAMVAAGVIDTMVIDELGVFRNPSAERTKNMIKFAPAMGNIWGMTGTPMPNEPTDVWAPAKIITPLTVPNHFGKFRDQMMLKISQFKFVPKQDSTQRAFEVLQPAVRYTLDDVMELPEQVTREIEVEMGPQQKKIYKSLADTCFAAIQSNQINAVNAGALLNKLMQVSTGWVYGADRKVMQLDCDARVQALIDAVDASDRKVLVFTPFKHTLAGLSEAFTKAGIDHETVSGDTSANQRGEVFNRFQNTNRPKAIIAHPLVMAHGLTLTEADTIAWYSPITSLEIFEQANARIRRVGQKHKQLYLQFQGSPVEKKLYAMLAKRQHLQDNFLELFAEATKLSQ